MSGSGAPRGATAPVFDPAERHLVETFVRGEQVFGGRMLDVRRDVVSLPDGREASREYVVHPGAAVVVPILDDGRLLMERQFRYPIGRVVLEFPAGKLDAGELPLVCARRELTEETGYTAREWARAGITHNAMAYSTEIIEVWFARGLTPGARDPEDGELIDTCTVSEAELDAACGRGDVTDAKTLVGLLWLQRWRSGAWALQWFAPADGERRP
ncbi:MAG: NUDIX hydrolase [Burkholderiaceae bacterium]